MKTFILFGLLGLFALLLTLVAALLVLAPRLINQPVAKERIEAALARALGGPVTYERADLSLLPHPHVLIHDPHVSLRGTLSGTLTSLEIYAELRPLLTGTVRITSVGLDRPDFTLTLSGDAERPTGAMAFRMPQIAVHINRGRLTIMKKRERLLTLQNLDMRIDALPTAPQSGDERAARTEPFRIVGSVQGVITDASSQPGPIDFSVAQFDARPQTLLLSDARIRVLDTPFTVSGHLDDYLTTLQTADVTLNGTIGPETVRWIRTLTALPPEMTLHAPVTLSRGHLVWHHDGTLQVEGAASGQNGLALSFDLSRTPETLTVKALQIRDAESQAALTLTLMQQRLEFSFSGHLSQTTLNSLFEHERFRFGSIRGDLSARIALDRPSDSTARGALEGDQLVPPFTLNAPVIINRVVLKAAGRTVTMNPLVVTVGGRTHTVTGDVTATADGWRLNVKSDGLEWEPLQALFASKEAEAPAVPSDKPQKPAAPVRVILRLDAASFSAGGWTAKPARAEIAFNPDGTHIRLSEAVVCGILLSGTVTMQPARLDLRLTTTARRQPLASSLSCLTGRNLHLTGVYDLSGTFTSRGETSAWLDHLRGTAAVAADVDIEHQQTTTTHRIKGDAALTADHWGIDLKSDGLEWEPLHALFAQDQEKATRPALPKPVLLRLDADSLSAGGWTAKPARAEIAFNPDGTHIRLDEAVVCGILLSGTVTVQPEELELNIRTTASAQPLDASLNCLSGKNLRITGTYNLSGAFTSRGAQSQWFDHLKGSVSLMARDGRIYHDLAIAKILQYLNTTELLYGKFPDPEKEGIQYTSAELRGTLINHVFNIDESILISPVADITGRGSLNLAERTLDSTYLVAPFPSADAVVRNIPLLNTLLNNSLVTIPIRVRGPYEDPTVTTLPPEQVADELGGMMKRVLTLPFALISPIRPGTR